MSDNLYELASFSLDNVSLFLTLFEEKMESLNKFLSKDLENLTKVIQAFAERISIICKEYIDRYETVIQSWIDTVTAESIHEPELFVNNQSNAPPRISIDELINSIKNFPSDYPKMYVLITKVLRLVISEFIKEWIKSIFNN